MKSVLLCLIVLPIPVLSHPGGLDDNGGHIDRSTRAYHCHRTGCILPATARIASTTVTSFNIKFLGHYKNRDTTALAELLSDQDIVLIQELVAPPYVGTFPNGDQYRPDVEATEFFDVMGAHGFEYILSEEDTGTANKNHINSSATEWWVAFYKSEGVAYADDLPHGFLASDRTNHQDYERVPYAFPFRTMNGNDFVLISVHLMPGDSRRAASRRLEELDAIYEWIANNDEEEHDFVIAGDMNIEDCDELARVLRSGFHSLNKSCVATNTNTRSPKPYDHVIHNGIQEMSDEFTVRNLIDAMRPSWALRSHDTYPGDPYDRHTFPAVYSDHHPVQFRLSTSADDD